VETQSSVVSSRFLVFLGNELDNMVFSAAGVK
jgi:hypothetical protein